MSLAPAPSDAELRRMAIDRQRARYGRVIDPALIEAKDINGPVATGSRARALQGRQTVPPDHDRADARMVDFIVAAQTDPSMSAPIWGRREQGNRLWLEIETPPRTKKNGRKGAWFGVGGKAYKRFEQDVVGAVASLKTALRLPLPEGNYTIAITYYVDRYGARADRPGLDQGLFDALEKAGVVTSDWQFRQTDGTRIHIGDARPRVEVCITPLQEL